MLLDLPRSVNKKRAKLKIILKTKDEAGLLQDWINHHAKIVGLENLIILDNLSSDRDVLNLYHRYASAILIGAFDGFLNNPHSLYMFSDFYSWLDENAEYYIILDTDERLVWLEGDKYFSDSRIVEKLAQKKTASGLPGTWLYNQPGSQQEYCFGSRGGLVDGLRWGKPVISTTAERPDTIIHNCQSLNLFDPPLTNLFVLHLSRISARQKLRTNINKLRSYSMISKDDGIEEITKIDISSVEDPSISRLIETTLELVNIGEYPSRIDKATPYSIVLKNGKIIFGASDQKNLLAEFVSESMSFLAECGSQVQ